MLTAEIIKSNEVLKGLGEDQIAAIAKLSENDENVVIGKRVGEIWGSIDRDVEETIGLKKPEGIKTFEWMKKDILPKAKQAKDLEGKIATQLATIADLEKQIREGKGDETIRKALKDAEDKATQLQNTYTEKEKEWQKKVEESVGEVSKMKLNIAFNESLQGIKFKDEKLVPKSLQTLSYENAKSSVLSKYDPDYISEGGRTILVFRDKATKEIARNPANALNPYTAKELILKEDIMKDVIDQGKTQGGGGAGGAGGAGGGSDPVVLDMSSAKTQVEADVIIKKHLLANGVAVGTKEFNEQSLKIRRDNEVAKLPLR